MFVHTITTIMYVGICMFVVCAIVYVCLKTLSRLVRMITIEGKGYLEVASDHDLGKPPMWYTMTWKIHLHHILLIFQSITIFNGNELSVLLDTRNLVQT